MTKRIFAVLCSIALLLMAVPADAQAVTSSVATVSLTMAVPESISMAASPAAISFTYNQTAATATASGNITATYSWNVAKTRTQLNILVWLGSASAALTNGATNIPSSDVFVNWTGVNSGPAACTGSDSLSPVQGADCEYNGTNLFAESFSSTATTAPTQATQFAAIPYTGSQSIVFAIAMQNLPTLTPGSYTGTINFEAMVQ